MSRHRHDRAGLSSYRAEAGGTLAPCDMAPPRRNRLDPTGFRAAAARVTGPLDAGRRAGCGTITTLAGPFCAGPMPAAACGPVSLRFALPQPRSR
jgi:hypothetical protein